MRFEVMVDDARGMPALEAARLEAKAPDMPSFVQAIVDTKVAEAQAKYLPAALSYGEALQKITILEADKASLEAQVAQLSAPETTLSVATI